MNIKTIDNKIKIKNLKKEIQDKVLKIIDLRKKGLTFQEIGDRLDTTRQAVHFYLKYHTARNVQRELLKEKELFLNVDWYWKHKKDFLREGIKKFLFEKVKQNQLKNPIDIKKNISEQTKMKEGARDQYRELVRIRDNHQCQLCGRKWKRGRRLDIHHIIGNNDDSLKCDTNFSNQITLCHQCHLRVDSWKMLKKEG